MKTMTKVLTVAAALVIALSIATPVDASCGTLAQIKNSDAAGKSSFIVNPQFLAFANYVPAAYATTGPYGPFTYYCFGCEPPLPPVPPLSAAAEISFWRTGTGDPANTGSGDDNGVYDMIASGGFYYGNPYPNANGGGRLFGSWQPAGIDGCIDGGIAGNASCMCLLITDQDGTDGSWAILGGLSNASLNTDLSIGGTDGVANLAPIHLVNQVSPIITFSQRVDRGDGGFDVDLTVSVPSQTGGVYTQDSCACGPVGFKIVQQVVDRSATPPSNRDAGAWTEPALAGGGDQTVTPLGGSVTVRSLCGSTNKDVYLAAQLVFDSDFTTTHVSGNSARVECGPSLADPDDKPSPVRPTRPDRPNPRRR